MKKSEKIIKKIATSLGGITEKQKKGIFGKQLVAQGNYRNRYVVVYCFKDKIIFSSDIYKILIGLKNYSTSIQSTDFIYIVKDKSIEFRNLKTGGISFSETEIKKNLGELSQIKNKIWISIFFDKVIIIKTEGTTVLGLKKIIDRFIDIAGNFE